MRPALAVGICLRSHHPFGPCIVMDRPQGIAAQIFLRPGDASHREPQDEHAAGRGEGIAPPVDVVFEIHQHACRSEYGEYVRDLMQYYLNNSMSFSRLELMTPSVTSEDITTYSIFSVFLMNHFEGIDSRRVSRSRMMSSMRC